MTDQPWHIGPSGVPIEKPPAEMTDAELNAAVAQEVIGWDDDHIAFTLAHHWSPATDIAAAFEVVEEMRGRGWRFTMMGDEGGEPFARFHRGTHIGRSDKMWSRAICEAALAAVRSGHA